LKKTFNTTSFLSEFNNISKKTFSTTSFFKMDPVTPVVLATANPARSVTVPLAIAVVVASYFFGLFNPPEVLAVEQTQPALGVSVFTQHAMITQYLQMVENINFVAYPAINTQNGTVLREILQGYESFIYVHERFYHVIHGLLDLTEGSGLIVFDAYESVFEWWRRAGVSSLHVARTIEEKLDITFPESTIHPDFR
jgi:hypothetical protein